MVVGEIQNELGMGLESDARQPQLRAGENSTRKKPPSTIPPNTLNTT